MTVVIPAYRAENTIRRAVDTVLAQAGVQARVVVVVDGQLDDCARRLQDYPSSSVTVVLNEVNEGAARARNTGLARATSEFVMFLDADDFIEGDLLHGLVSVMRQSSADIGFAPMEILHEGQGQREPRRVPRFTSAEDVFRQWHGEGIYVGTCSLMWRTEFVRSIGGWDPEITRNDDGELAMRAILLGAKVALSKRGAGVYVKHSDQSMNNRSDNLPSLLRANEKLLALDSSWLDKATQTEICARHYYNAAWHCFRAGEDDLGREALARSRRLGFVGSKGPLLNRALDRAVGLRWAVKLSLLARSLGALVRKSIRGA